MQPFPISPELALPTPPTTSYNISANGTKKARKVPLPLKQIYNSSLIGALPLAKIYLLCGNLEVFATRWGLERICNPHPHPALSDNRKKNRLADFGWVPVPLRQ